MKVRKSKKRAVRIGMWNGRAHSGENDLSPIAELKPSLHLIHSSTRNIKNETFAFIITFQYIETILAWSKVHGRGLYVDLGHA